MTLGQKIKKLRNEKGLTQKDLADSLNVTFQTVSKWENDENEPDVNTLKELSKIFECSIDFLLNEEEIDYKKETTPIIVEKPVETKTIIVHEYPQHICKKCGKPIEDDDLYVEQLTKSVHSGRSYHSVPYGEAFYHKSCWEEVEAERKAAQDKIAQEKLSKAKRFCFGWGIFAGLVALGISLAVFLNKTDNVFTSILFSLLIGYGLFAMLYCILSGSYIGDVFVKTASFSVRFPGIIFSWSLDGFAFLIVMKILFAVLGFFIGLFAIAFAIALSAALGGISFPFVLIHNNNTNYEDVII